MRDSCKRNGENQAGYTDEFGAVAPDVYDTAGRIWCRAQEFAARVLHDSDEARHRTLLIKGAARVTWARGLKGVEIHSLDCYLFQTYKHVVLAEAKKEANRLRLGAQAVGESEWIDQASNVERRILLNELVASMDEWTRSVFELLTLDYTLDEIARHLGVNVKVLRNRYNRRLTVLMRQMSRRDSALTTRNISRSR